MVAVRSKSRKHLEHIDARTVFPLRSCLIITWHDAHHRLIKDLVTGCPQLTVLADRSDQSPAETVALSLDCLRTRLDTSAEFAFQCRLSSVGISGIFTYGQGRSDGGILVYSLYPQIHPLNFWGFLKCLLFYLTRGLFWSWGHGVY